MLYKWRTYVVSNYPKGTVGYVGGDQIGHNLAKELSIIAETEKEEVFTISIVSSHTAYIITRELIR